MVKSILVIPLYAGTNLSYLGFLWHWWNTMTEEQVGEERVYLAHMSTALFIIEGNQDRNSHRAGTWRQELVQRPWRSTLYWPASPDLLSLLSYRTQNQTRGGTTHNGLDHPKSFTNYDNYSCISWRHFPTLGSFLSGASSLCQVDTKPTSMVT